MVRKGLTEKQRQVYDILVESQKIHGFVPTMSAIAEKIGVTKSTVQVHLKALESRGWIKAAGGKKSGITIY
jgi:DNA-binding MarR family transcriptional regulator|tara:strand:- start:1316 stop:1528 length:213 start_codon:yes stop_codon:yes gene_type:complete